MKAVIKRPWLHHLIIVCYIAAPFANIFLLMAFLHLPFATVFARLLAGYGVLATVWLFTAPIVGISLYFVQKFSWYVFLAHSGIILLDFVVKWATRPAYYLRTVPGVHNILLLTGNLALVAFVAYIIQRDFRAPYFQVLNRNWRERVRVPIYHTVMIDGQPRIMNDLSTGGCFVMESGGERKPGTRVKLSFQSSTLNIECVSEIMRVTGTGLGLRFHHLAAAKRRDISRMLKNRFSLRQKVDISCTWVFRNEESQSRMIDLSSGGCYLEANFAGVNEGSTGDLRVVLPHNKRSYSLPGEVVWINNIGEHGKPLGFGFRFSRRQAAFMKDVTVNFGQGMLVR